MATENTVVQSILVTGLKNEPLDLMQEYRGKTILAIIYNNQCLGCTGRAIPLAYEFMKEYKEIVVVGIHTSFNNAVVTEEDIKSIFTLRELPFPIYLDKDKSVYDAMNAEGTPQWILITKDGVLFRSIFGSQEGAQNRLMYSLEQLQF